jgi:uncharacterized protein YjiS (DUF1127 family)
VAAPIRGKATAFPTPNPEENTMNANLTASYSSPSSFTSVSRLTGVAGRVVDLLATWHQRAADRQYLLTLDDGMLRDIGLSRADVEFESSKPFWRG